MKKIILFLLLSCIWYSPASTESCVNTSEAPEGRAQTTYPDGLSRTQYSNTDPRLQSVMYPDEKTLWEYKDGTVRILYQDGTFKTLVDEDETVESKTADKANIGCDRCAF